MNEREFRLASCSSAQGDATTSSAFLLGRDTSDVRCSVSARHVLLPLVSVSTTTNLKMAPNGCSKN
jgi:hypothetical protein